MTSPKRTFNPNLPNFFNLQYMSNRIFWGFDQLSSTVVWRVLEENVHHCLAPKFWSARDLKGFNIESEVLDCMKKMLKRLYSWIKIFCTLYSGREKRGLKRRDVPSAISNCVQNQLTLMQNYRHVVYEWMKSMLFHIPRNSFQIWISVFFQSTKQPEALHHVAQF